MRACLSEDEFSALLEHAAGDTAWLHLSECAECAAVFSELVEHSAANSPWSERFRLSRCVGHGPHGTVFEAHDHQHDRTVALKLLREAPRPTWADELRPFVGLSHPHLCSLRETGVEGTRCWLVSDFASGLSVQMVSPIPREEAHQAMRQVAEALACLHDHGVVHGELKPTNVVLTPGGARLTDAGVRRALRRPSNERVMGLPLGWLAPEQRLGGPLSEKADQYGFGLCFWLALFGVRPRSGEQSVAFADPPLARLVAVLRRALSSDPSARFDSMTDLREAL